ncbi:MAG TPA: CvpA family protein [Chloroflexota bacterium]
MIPNWLDMLVALLIVAGAWRGYRRGLIREGMALLGLLGGMIVASRFHEAVASLIEPFVGRGFADGIAYGGIVLLILGAATLFTLALKRLMKFVFAGRLDTAAGVIFGGLQGAVLASLVLLVMVKFRMFGVDKSFEDSQLAVAALALLPGIAGLLPEELGSLAGLFQAAR